MTPNPPEARPHTDDRLVSGLAEFTLETASLPALERFYRHVIGLELLSRDEDRVWLAAGDYTRLGLWSPGAKEFGDRGGSHVHFALSVTPGRLEELARRLCDAGTEVRGPVEHRGGDRSIYFRDPAGNLVEAWDFFERDRGASRGVSAL